MRDTYYALLFFTYFDHDLPFGVPVFDMAVRRGNLI